MLSIYDQILKTPSFVKELKDFQLEEQVQLAKQAKQKWLKEFYDARPLNPGYTLDEWKTEMLYDEMLADFDKQEETFWLEILRRQNKFTPEQIAYMRRPNFKGERTPYEFIRDLELVTFSYEDWYKHDDVLHKRERFYTIGYSNEGGKVRAHYLPESEYQKIRAKQREIKNKMFDTYFTPFISKVEKELETSLDPVDLINGKIETVTRYLKDKDFDGLIIFEVSKYKVKGFGGFNGLDRGKDEDINPFPELYKIYISEGKDPSEEIKPNHEISGDLIGPVAVHVLFEYKKYLEGVALHLQNIQTENKEPVSLKKAPRPPVSKPLPQLEEIVNVGFDLPVFWKQLSTLPKSFVSESGQFIWSHNKRYHAPILALSQTLITRGKIAGRDIITVYLILCNHFKVPPSNRADKLLNGHSYKDYLEQFLDLLE